MILVVYRRSVKTFCYAVCSEHWLFFTREWLLKDGCAVVSYEGAVNLPCRSAMDFGSKTRNPNSGLQFRLRNCQRFHGCNTYFSEYKSYFWNDSSVSYNFLRRKATALKTFRELSPNTCNSKE